MTVSTDRRLSRPVSRRRMSAELVAVLADAVQMDALRPSPRAGWREFSEIADLLLERCWRRRHGASAVGAEATLAAYRGLLGGLTSEGVLERCVNRNGWTWWRLRPDFSEAADP